MMKQWTHFFIESVLLVDFNLTSDLVVLAEASKLWILKQKAKLIYFKTDAMIK